MMALALAVAILTSAPAGCEPLGAVSARTYLRRPANEAARVATADLLRKAERRGGTAVVMPRTVQTEYLNISPQRITIKIEAEAYRCEP